MRAITIPRFGGPEVLELSEREDPAPKPGQVAIDVAFAGVNYAEVLYRRGAVDVELPFIPGIEVAGHVRSLGEGVDGLAAGDRVAGLTIVDGGGYAEVAVTDARLVRPVAWPEAPDLALAAVVPSNSTTALLIFDLVARLREGEAVLVHAAAGGVGSQLGQAARMLGASRVVGTVGSLDKVEVAKSFGYDAVVVRERLGEAGADLGKFDVVVDPVGGASRRLSYKALNLGGRLIAMGNASGSADVEFGANELWLDSKAVLGFNLAAFAGQYPERVGEALARALDAVGRGTMRVQVSDRLPLARAADAHRLVESGASTGKLVLEVREQRPRFGSSGS